ncbi:hypothetical protein [Alteromonas macleodii]|uniref:Phage protein n=1 Tax=Alteromonas macleodii TaxID=28108 RepID=A0AB36FQZ6_ALTMA|nr:hypothetical protein [Alteromonas macleodii]OES24474.1 hypothetical protein BFV95_4741 [Alteromonas macleodii]OES25531.1 hypothetical protein BFV94_4384 [Alteromonas macleodii]OES25832.1 hypothetical protein BFV93_4295 [Alteromonas macleodii]OES38646.1 hypothetical protein BFV96_4757 [Alteromonas macleodii]
MKTGAQLISEERQRQIDDEGYTPSSDDTYSQPELVDAAICYASRCSDIDVDTVRDWPWNEEYWKPTDDKVKTLTKAGALIAAEIDRLQRQATK